METFYDRPGVLINTLNEDDDDLELYYRENIWLQKELVEFKQQNLSKDKSVDFIGAHPVSLSKVKLSEIKRNMRDWLVCEKSDGVRYLMIILNNGHVYLTGRNVGGLAQVQKSYQLFRVKVMIPQLFIQNGDLAILEMFDGELIVDRYPNNNERLNYLIFDTLIHNGKQTITLEGVTYQYMDRLKCAKEYLQLRKFMKANSQIVALESQTLKYMPEIKCMLKDFFMVSQIKYIATQYIPLMPHHNDGLIFTSNSAQYKTGTCQSIVKWKPPEKNSIDFLLCQNKKIPVTDSTKALVELYVINTFNGERMLMLFDMILVDMELLAEINKQIDTLYSVLESEGKMQSIKGIVTECVLEKLPNQVDKIKQLFTPQSWGIGNTDVDVFLKQILKHANHIETDQLANQQFMDSQFDLLKQVREQIHLRYNFKTTWKIEKYRTDKTAPNSRMVASNVTEIINENLTMDELIQEIEHQDR